MITIFKDSFDTNNPKHISVETALKRIRDGKSKHIVDAIRKGDSGQKKNLPSVVFGGECRKAVEKVKPDGVKYISFRDDNSVTTHSGFFVLDFDKVKDVAAKKKVLMLDDYIYACWVSPSGNGLKALVKCRPDIERHKDMYLAFVDRYPELDTTSQNIARLCYESYDPDIYINPNSKVWEMMATKKEVREIKRGTQERRNNRIISIAVSMVRASVDGEKHGNLLKAAKLLGGYIAIGKIDEAHARQVLEDEIRAKNPKDMNGALKTIDDGIAYGKAQPVQETKKIEKSVEFTINEEGNYDFLASDSEMDDYINAVINGTLEMGSSTGLQNLDYFFRLKRNTMVWFGGVDNSGKTTVMWYLSVLAAIFNDWKFLVYSAENNDGQARKKIIELYLNKPIKECSKQEIESGKKWFSEHYKIMTNRKFYSLEDFLLRAEIVFDEGWEYDCLMADPYNSFEIKDNQYIENISNLNKLRVFKENYSSVWVADHVTSSAARDKGEGGKINRPYKSQIEGGQIKANKVDDFIIIHRDTKDPENWMYNQIHIDKVKDTETGGKPTPNEEPVMLRSNPDLCGFECGGIDPVRKYWNKKILQSSLEL